MDQMRLLIALVLSFLVFMLWNVFFSHEPKQKPIPQLQQETQKEEKKEPAASTTPPVAPKPAEQSSAVAAKPERPARQITVDTPLYRARLFEKGAGIISFPLKNYRETAEADSALKNLFPESGVFNGLIVGLAGKGPAGFENALFEASLGGDQLSLTDGSREIVFRRAGEDGLQIEIAYRFQAD